MPRNVQQSPIPDLAAHLGIKRCSIQNNVEFVGFFAKQHCFDD